MRADGRPRSRRRCVTGGAGRRVKRPHTVIGTAGQQNRPAHNRLGAVGAGPGEFGGIADELRANRWRGPSRPATSIVQERLVMHPSRVLSAEAVA